MAVELSKEAQEFLDWLRSILAEWAENEGPDHWMLRPDEIVPAAELIRANLVTATSGVGSWIELRLVG